MVYNFDLLKGKIIAVIYIFEGEDAPGFDHYHVWKSDIISQWLMAIQDLKCIPLIIDVRTFAEKMMNKTMPHIDFVINLNCGSSELSPMALIPSICAFYHIPCIPCDSVAILAGENKLTANLIAQSTGLTVPNDIVDLDTEGIFRPFGLGSSIGVKKMTLAEKSSDMHGLLQEFICGYDITTPIVFNPITGNLDFLPTVLYIPEKDSTNWFLGETEKESRSGFKRVSILNLSTELKQVFLKYAHNMSITTYCRIDARIKCNSTDELSHILAHPLTLNNTFFVEMNPMPTVWINNALSYSFQNINTIQSFDEYLLQLKKHVPKKNIHNFLLSISMFALYHSHVQK